MSQMIAQALRGLAIGPLAALMVACTSCSPDEERPAVHSRPMRTDSAGIQVVESGSPVWSRERELRVVNVIGTADSVAPNGDRESADSAIVLFDRVLDTRVLEGHRVVVADAGRNEILVFDSIGRMEIRFLRRGDGPGEVNTLVGLARCGGDSIVVADRFKVAFFDLRGAFARQAMYRTGGEATALLGVSSDCSRLLAAQTADAPPEGTIGVSNDRLVWIDSAEGSTESLATVGALEVWSRELYGAPRPFVVPWGTSRTYAIARDRIFVGYGRVPEVRVYDAAGTLERIVRWAAEPMPLTRAERDRYEEVRLRWLADMPDDPESMFLFPPLDEYPDLAPTIPLFDRILASDDGAFWVREFPAGSFGAFDARLRDVVEHPQRWLAFDSAGTWLGSVQLPARFDLKAVAGDRLYGVAEDDNDVHTVHVLSLVPAGRSR